MIPHRTLVFISAALASLAVVSVASAIEYQIPSATIVNQELAPAEGKPTRAPSPATPPKTASKGTVKKTTSQKESKIVFTGLEKPTVKTTTVQVQAAPGMWGNIKSIGKSIFGFFKKADQWTSKKVVAATKWVGGQVGQLAAAVKNSLSTGGKSLVSFAKQKVVGIYTHIAKPLVKTAIKHPLSTALVAGVGVGLVAAIYTAPTWAPGVAPVLWSGALALGTKALVKLGILAPSVLVEEEKKLAAKKEEKVTTKKSTAKAKASTTKANAKAPSTRTNPDAIPQASLVKAEKEKQEKQKTETVSESKAKHSEQVSEKASTEEKKAKVTDSDTDAKKTTSKATTEAKKTETVSKKTDTAKAKNEVATTPVHAPTGIPRSVSLGEFTQAYKAGARLDFGQVYNGQAYLHLENGDVLSYDYQSAGLAGGTIAAVLASQMGRITTFMRKQENV